MMGIQRRAAIVLWAVGVSYGVIYGVIKLANDPPHWSSDGH